MEKLKNILMLIACGDLFLAAQVLLEMFLGNESLGMFMGLVGLIFCFAALLYPIYIIFADVLKFKNRFSNEDKHKRLN